jgi:hypothetical protein
MSGGRNLKKKDEDLQLGDTGLLLGLRELLFCIQHEFSSLRSRERGGVRRRGSTTAVVWQNVSRASGQPVLSVTMGTVLRGGKW